MMLKGQYLSTSRTMDGELVVSFVVDEFDTSKLIKDTELSIDINKYYNKRSLQANRYLWKLCDLIAKAIGSDKDTVYLIQLQRYGVWVDIEVIDEAVDVLTDRFKFYEVLDSHDGCSEVRCYFGSSTYNTKEMADLLNGTVADAKEIGIDTWSQDEIDRLIADWRRDDKHT